MAKNNGNYKVKNSMYDHLIKVYHGCGTGSLENVPLGRKDRKRGLE